MIGGLAGLKMFTVRQKGKGKTPWVVGHRGAMGHAPENTMTSFEEALSLGCDMFEFDVRLSKDGEPVIVHDSNLDRTSNRSLNVADLSTKDLLELDAGSWFDMRFAGERIPRLSTLLEWAAPKKTKAGGKLSFFVELKVDGDESRRETLIKAVLKELKANNVLDRSVLISFDEPALVLTRRINPTIATGFLYADFLYDALDRAKRLKTNHILPRKDRVTGDLVDEAHAAGMAVVAWTADRLDEFRKLVVWGVDGIATNYPDRLLEFYDR
jgi:glycerophosphoryl diester phosphodiesterase